VKQLKLKVGDPVYIEWDDHCTGNSGWTEFEDVKENIFCVQTIGFVALDSKKAVTVTLMFQGDREVISESITIIKSCITKIKKIKI